MLTLAFAKDLDSAGVALLDIGLGDLGDRLALHDVIAHRNIDRRQPSGGSGYGVDDATATADQNPLTSRAGRNSSDDAPCQRGRQSQANHERQNPVERFGNADQVIKLFGRCGSLQRHRTECQLRPLSHTVVLRFTLDPRIGISGASNGGFSRMYTAYPRSPCWIIHQSRCRTTKPEG